MQKTKKGATLIVALALVGAGLSVASSPASAEPTPAPRVAAKVGDMVKAPNGKMVKVLPPLAGSSTANRVAPGTDTKVPTKGFPSTKVDSGLKIKGKPDAKGELKAADNVSAMAGDCGGQECFLYNGGRQDGTTMPVGYRNGVTGKFRPGCHQGGLTGADSHHTLLEAAVQGSNNGNIVEVGITADPIVNKTNGVGSYRCRFFVFHWVNGDPSQYNGGGFVPVSGTTIVPGVTDLPQASTEYVYDIWFDPNGGVSGNWWLGGGIAGTTTEWFGYFPETLWSAPAAGQPGWLSGTGTQPSYPMVAADLIQLFGEIASPYDKPCSDMGRGIIANNTTSSRFTETAYRGPSFTGTGTGVNLGTFRIPSATAGSPYGNTYSFGPAGAQRGFGLGGPMHWGIDGVNGPGAGVVGNPC